MNINMPKLTLKLYLFMPSIAIGIVLGYTSGYISGIVWACLTEAVLIVVAWMFQGALRTPQHNKKLDSNGRAVRNHATPK